MEVINTIPAQTNPVWAEQEDGKVVGFYREEDPCAVVSTWPWLNPSVAEDEVLRVAPKPSEEDAQFPAPPPTPFANPTWAEQEDGKVAGFYREDDPSITICTLPWFAPAQAEEEVLARLGFGDEDSSITVCALPWVNPKWAEAEEDKVAGFYREEDPSFAVTAMPGWSPQSFADEEVVRYVAPSVFYREEDTSLNTTFITGWYPQSYAEQEDGKVVGFYRDDEPSIVITVPPFANPLQAEEEVLARLGFGDEDPSYIVTTQPGQTTTVLWVEEETLARLGFGDEDPSFTVTAQPGWTPRSFTADDEVTTPRNPVEEDQLNTPATAASWWWPRPIAESDERVTPPPQRVDDDAQQAFSTLLAWWTPTPFTVDEWWMPLPPPPTWPLIFLASNVQRNVGMDANIQRNVSLTSDAGAGA